MKTNEEHLVKAPLIEMTDVSVFPARLRGKVEVENVDWRVMPGDFWAIGGLFGSGKSDFLATAAGLHRPVHGSVKLFGEETFALKEDTLIQQRRRTGLVFSGGGRLFNRSTVAENIALPLCYHNNWKEAEARTGVDEVLKLTELTTMAKRMPSTLSPNWQQRAALARALILKPEILLLDKPILGMDFRHQRWWLDFLTALSKGSAYFDGKPVTIVVTADDFAPWKDAAQQFAMLKSGRWHEIGGRAKLEGSGEAALREVWAEND